jgi:hypothetical protein
LEDISSPSSSEAQYPLLPHALPLFPLFAITGRIPAKPTLDRYYLSVQGAANAFLYFRYFYKKIVGKENITSIKKYKLNPRNN